MSNKSIKTGVTKFPGKHIRGIGFPLGVIIIAGLAFFIFLNPLPPGAKVPHIVPVGILIILGLAWMAVWGWYFVTFRYILYFTARLLSLIRRFLANGLVRFLILLFIVVSVQRWRSYLMSDTPGRISIFDPGELLHLSFIITSLSLTLIILLFIGLFKARKLIVISDFSNHTGFEALDNPVKGIAPAVVSEIVRLVNLYKTIDEIRPKAENDLLKATLSVAAIDKDLEDALGGKFEVKVGPGVNINVGSLLKLLGRITRGPKLCGSLQREDNGLVLTAWVTGGRMHGNWRARGGGSDDFTLQSITGEISGMIEEITYRMFTDLNKIGTPRWEVVKRYSEGLRKYRDTERTEVNRMILLNEAKAAFNEALSKDDRFAECYYNLGIIYNKLGNKKSAEAAFRKALEEKPDDYNSYFELARYFRADGDYANAGWFCEQTVNLQPYNPKAWNLMAVILYEKWYKKEGHYKEDTFDERLDFNNEIIEKVRAAAALSWKELTHALTKNRVTKIHRNNAALCIRNLAALKGLKCERFSGRIFRQAFFLSPDNPDNNDLYFELGRYYYRKKRYPQARKAFFKIYEDALDVEDALRFWACYTHANTEQKAPGYQGIIKDGITHFLDIAADMLQDEDSPLEDEINDHRFKQCIRKMRAALNFIPSNERVKEKDIDYISRLRENLAELKSIDDINKMKNIYDMTSKNISKDMTWAGSQLNIAAAKRALEIEPNNDISIRLLIEAIEKLNHDYRRQIKKLRLHKYLAEAYLNKKAFKSALSHARQAVRLNPFKAEERLLLGRVYCSLKNYEKALVELEYSFRLEPGNLEILTELGETYKERGENACEPEEIKRAFNSALKIFEQALKIVGSSSYCESERESKIYANFIGLIHYYLGTFHYELVAYDASAAHFRTAARMGYKPMHSLVKAGWSYINAGSFFQAGQALDEAENVYKRRSETNKKHLIELKLAQVAAFVEGAVSIRDENRENYINANKRLDSVKIRIEELKEKDREFISLARAMYHECRGLLFFKKGNRLEAVSELEQAVDNRANARIYLRLAEVHRQCAAEATKKTDRRSHLFLARNACTLSQRHDLREKYGENIRLLLLEIETLEKVEKPGTKKKQSDK